MNLLESLDSHAFTLLASLTLSGHSRVKDLWIFTGSSDEPQEDIKAIGDTALLDTPPASPRMGSDADNHRTHTKAATMPFPGANTRTTSHARSASEGTRQSLSPGRLRESHFDSSFPWKKGSPRMRIPSTIQGSPELGRVEMASFISGSNDMTGIGAGVAVLSQKPDVGYPRFSGMPIPDTNSPLTPLTDQTIHTSHSNVRPRVPALVSPPNIPLVSSPPPPILPPLRRAFSQDSYIADRPYSDGAQYLDLSPPHPFPTAISTPSSTKHATPPVDQPQTPSPPSSPSPPPVADLDYRMTTATGTTGRTVSALLGPNAFGVRSDGASDYATTGFRDSAYTTGTSTNEWKSEVPIRWTTSSQLQRDLSRGHESVSTHPLPGGWKPTPVEEKEEDVANGFTDQDHGFPIPSYQRQRTPERHNADAPRSPEIIEQEDMGRLGKVGVIGVYGEHEPEDKKEKKPSKTTPPQEGRPLRVSDSSVTRVPPNKLKRLSEGWVMVNVENSHKRPPIVEEAVPVPSRREDVNPRARAQRMVRGRSHSDPQLRQTAEQHEHDQYSRPHPTYSQKHSNSRDSPSKSSRDRDRSGHKDKDRDRTENRNGHHRPSPRRTPGSSSSRDVLKGTTSHAAKAIAMIDAVGSKEKGYRDDDYNYATYPGVRQTPMSPGQRTFKKLLGRGGETVEKSEKPSKKSKKQTSTRSHKVD